MTEQLSKWHRQSLDIRDREMQLHETNKQLREMTAEELNDPETRKRLETQAAAEAANGRRLSQLSKMGDELVRQASRNSEIGVGHTLKSGPKCSKCSRTFHPTECRASRTCFDNRPRLQAWPLLNRPSHRDHRSAKFVTHPADQRLSKKSQPLNPANPSRPFQASPTANLHSNQPMKSSGWQEEEREQARSLDVAPDDHRRSCFEEERRRRRRKPQDAALEEAVKEQADLLAEFEKIADELNSVLANLEGSTLVKRLKAASREQLQVAGKISDRIDAMFGQSTALQEADRKILKSLAEVETNSVQTISYIMDDMQAYFERRRMNQFKVVLDEMREVDVLAAMRTLGEEIPKEARNVDRSS